MFRMSPSRSGRESGMPARAGMQCMRRQQGQACGARPARRLRRPLPARLCANQRAGARVAPPAPATATSGGSASASRSREQGAGVNWGAGAAPARTVADALVDAGADALREGPIVQRRGVGPRLDGHLVDCLVDCIRGHPRPHQAAGHVQHLCRQPPRRPHPLDARCVVHLRAVIPLRHAAAGGIGRPLDVGRDL